MLGTVQAFVAVWLHLLLDSGPGAKSIEVPSC
jgi:hypothetical protein